MRAIPEWRARELKMHHDRLERLKRDSVKWAAYIKKRNDYMTQYYADPARHEKHLKDMRAYSKAKREGIKK